MAEALLIDQAKADDRALLLRGLEPGAEEQLRALLAGDIEDEEEEPEVEGASITDLQAWIENANRLMGGGRRA